MGTTRSAHEESSYFAAEFTGTLRQAVAMVTTNGGVAIMAKDQEGRCSVMFSWPAAFTSTAGPGCSICPESDANRVAKLGGLPTSGSQQNLV